MSFRLVKLVSALCIVLIELGLVSGCALIQAAPTATPVPPTQTPLPTATATVTLSPTPVDTLTPTPTATLTATPTATATATATATVTQTATPHQVFNDPGTYDFGYLRCNGASFGSSHGKDLYFQYCVTRVVVAEDRSMTFNVVWILVVGFDIPRPTLDAMTVYLTDNLGNSYAYTAGGGDGLSGGSMGTGQVISCWFTFPAPKDGADSFAFHDESKWMDPMKINITGIRMALLKP